MTRIGRQLEYFKLHLKYLKNITHKMLNLTTLDALMWVSLCRLQGYAMDSMDWATIFNIWRNMRNLRILMLD